MLFLDLTLPTAAENVALDEALLEEAEAGGEPREVLRLWEPNAPIVVVGRSSRPEVEVHLEACARAGIPVLRRSSGGAAIVTGRGCLMYAVVLSYERHPELKGIDAAHRFVLSRLVAAVRTIVPEVERCGTSDLALVSPVHGVSGNRSARRLKFSGNSLRCKRRHLLYHGTLLYDFDLSLVEQCLAHPPREPGYRAGRPHGEFLANLPATSGELRAALASAWQTRVALPDWPHARTQQLVAKKYASPAWNLSGQSSL